MRIACTIHAPKWRRPGLRHLCLLVLAVAIAGPAIAQEATATFEQMQLKYRRMSVVHIEKCDYDQDGRFTKTERLCVSGIYQVMYLDND